MTAGFKRLLLIAIALTFVPLFLEGCGDSDDSTNTVRRRRKAKKKKKTRVITEKASLDLSRIPLRFRNIDWQKSDGISNLIRGSRDPFLPFVDDLRVKAEEEDEKKATTIETTIPEAEVGDLTLVALITGTAVHKAMVEDGRGVGHVIRSGDVVGRKHQMRVVRITRNEIIFKALEKPKDEKSPSEVRKVLRTQEELQELLP
jgi:hypothetical protein